MKLITTIAAGALTAGALLAPAAASADTSSFQDTKGDVAHGVDLWSAKVTNNKRVRVTLQHDNLVRDFRSGASVSLYLDTDADHKGPEFVLGGGLYEGSDYQLSRTNGWKAVGEPLSCRHSLSLDFAADRAYTWFGRKCLGSPTDVRVAVKVAGEKKNGTIVTDWLGSRRHFTAWVAQD
jgi:hypothetical protein